MLRPRMTSLKCMQKPNPESRDTQGVGQCPHTIPLCALPGCSSASPRGDSLLARLPSVIVLRATLPAPSRHPPGTLPAPYQHPPSTLPAPSPRATCDARSYLPHNTSRHHHTTTRHHTHTTRHHTPPHTTRCALSTCGGETDTDGDATGAGPRTAVHLGQSTQMEARNPRLAAPHRTDLG